MAIRLRPSKKVPAWAIIILACLMCAPLAMADVHTRLERLMDTIEQDDAEISHVRVDQIDLSDDKTILIDVREPEEYAVSRLPGAVNIADEAQLLAFAQAHKDANLVLYCSVGRRSADKVSYLQRAGVPNASNLVGSIFAWANEDLPMENEAGATKRVHPFNWWWGRQYLESGHYQGD